MIPTPYLREAARHLQRNPGFSALAVAAIALGAGATTAVFTLVSAVMLRPLPYPDPAALWSPALTATGARLADMPRFPFSYPKYQTFAAAQQPFAALAAYTGEQINLTGGDEPERVPSELVTPDYFGVLGAQPLVGRLFGAATEGAAGGERNVVLSEGLWRRRFGADPAVIGRTLEIERLPFTVVGVLPASFVALSPAPELWLPLAALPAVWGWPGALEEAQNHFLDVVARARPGLAPEAIAAGGAAAGQAVAEAHRTPPEFDDGSVWGARVESLAEVRRDPNLRRSLAILLAAVGGVQLVACANVAGLLLARSVSRRRELAVRASLGAGRGRLVSQLLGENLALVAVGGALGVLAASSLVRAIVAVAPQALSTWGVSGADLANLTAPRLDLPVALFALGTLAVSALLAGLAPALLAARTDPAEALRQGSGSLAGAGGHRRHGARQLLVVAQAAVAVVLLVGAGLLLRSLGRLLDVDPGFRSERVLSLRLVPSQGEYDGTSAPRMHEEVMTRVAALAGVQSVSTATCAPVSDACNGTIVRSVDGVAFERAAAPRVGSHNVGPGYFRTLGVPVVAGREFTAADRQGAPRVAIVSLSAARKLWPGEEPVGRRINIGMGMERDDVAEVVGVVGDVRYGALESPPREDVYLADLQSGWSAAMLFVRTAGDPLAALPAVREAVRSVAPSLPLVGVRTLEEQLARASSRTRFAASMLGVFSALALLLAALGVYGVVAQMVADRRRELGLRMALGAEARRVGRLVLGQGLRLAAAGVALGVPAAWATSRALETLLFDVVPGDPWTYAAVPLVVLAATAAASSLPAWRAARLDPARVLRAD
ncbi:MAG: ADOP family duplicated permease [Thermoanaerobaculia bacterium]|nr:ADOP family duplicated permease [Thermoanaerobaculia bacterium]